MPNSLPKPLTHLRKGERTRLRILEGSLRCFGRLGMEGASFSALAEFVGVHRALFVHYFVSKERLLQECLHYVGQRARAMTEQHMLAQTQEPDPVARYVRATFAWVNQEPDYASFHLLCVQRSTYDKATREAMGAIRQRAVALICGMIREGARAGVYPEPRNVLGTARKLHSIILGHVVALRVDDPDSSEPHESQCAEACRQVIDTAKGKKPRLR